MTKFLDIFIGKGERDQDCSNIIAWRWRQREVHRRQSAYSSPKRQAKKLPLRACTHILAFSVLGLSVFPYSKCG